MGSGSFVPPLRAAFFTGGEIGIKVIGRALSGVGLANVGSGPQSNDTGAGFEVEGVGIAIASGLAELSGAGLFLTADVPLWLRLGLSLRVELVLAWDPLGSKWSSGKFQSSISNSDATGSRNRGPFRSSKAFKFPSLTPDSGLAGELNTRGAVGAAAAFVLSKGSFLTANSAFFSFWADRSAFRAAAVVTATWGVTLISSRGLGRSGRRESRWTRGD